MRKVFLDKLPAYQFHLLQKFSDQMGHAVFTREGGVSSKPYDFLNVRFGVGDAEENVKKNRAFICAALGLEADQLYSADQAHTKNVQIIDEELMGYREPEKEFPNVDAFVTSVSGAAIMIQVADCQAILLYDPVKQVIAAVHAGWKGLAQDISGKTIRIMEKKFGADPANILVGISPSLGPCCAFFSDPEKELPENFHKFIDRGKRVDLWSFSLEQLSQHGIQPAHIELAKICTQCNGGQNKEERGRFYSFRGEKGITGRFGALAYLR